MNPQLPKNEYHAELVRLSDRVLVSIFQEPLLEQKNPCRRASFFMDSPPHKSVNEKMLEKWLDEWMSMDERPGKWFHGDLNPINYWLNDSMNDPMNDSTKASVELRKEWYEWMKEWFEINGTGVNQPWNMRDGKNQRSKNMLINQINSHKNKSK